MVWIQGNLNSGDAIRSETVVKNVARTRQRRTPAARRSFDAANTSDIYASWTSTSITPDELVYRSLRTLRARSRKLFASNDMAQSFLKMCRNHIVGDKGVRFCPKARDTAGTLDERANSALSRAWAVWGRNGYCDYKGKHDDASFDRLIINTVAVDGEAFIEELPGKDSAVSFRLYDPETVPLDYNKARGTGQNLIRFGIEYDKHDRPIAYYFRDRDGDITFNTGYEARNLRLQRIPAKRIQHVFIQDRVDLRRGFPWMSASMIRFHMLGKFEDTAIQNAIAGASKVGIISGEGSDEIIDGIDDEGQRIMETEHVGLYTTEGEIDFHTFDSKYPSTEYEPFIKTNTMFLAAGVGVNYHSLSGDLSGVNYSSLKHGTSEERENWKTLQAWFIFDWKRPQYNRWLKTNLLVGIKIPGGGTLKVQNIEKYQEIEFYGRRWIGPDPLKESSANVINARANFTSPQRIIMERGDDPTEVIEEIAEYYARMRELNIPVEVGANVININMGDENGQQNNKTD